MADQAIPRGWIFSRLPATATDIHEQHELDTNLGILKFTAPTAALEILATQLTPWNADPSGPMLATTAHWWPPELKTKNPQALVKKDFHLYTSSDQPAGMKWHFAINPREKTAYAWQ